MKHFETDEVICAGDSVGVTLSPVAAKKIAAHASWILEANTRLNLTAITSHEEMLRLHIADSLTAYPEVVQAPPGMMLDLGTGGGFPGLPLAVATGRHTVLLDSVKKKSRALKEFLDVEGLAEVSTIAERAEEHAAQIPSRYSVVVARAVAPLPALVELSAPLLVRGGRLVALKANPKQDELMSGDLVGEMTGMRLISVRPLVLAGGGEHRVIVTYETFADPELALPRQPGKAQKRPLA